MTHRDENIDEKQKTDRKSVSQLYGGIFFVTNVACNNGLASTQTQNGTIIPIYVHRMIKA